MRRFELVNDDFSDRPTDKKLLAYPHIANENDDPLHGVISHDAYPEKDSGPTPYLYPDKFADPSSKYPEKIL